MRCVPCSSRKLTLAIQSECCEKLSAVQSYRLHTSRAVLGWLLWSHLQHSFWLKPTEFRYQQKRKQDLSRSRIISERNSSECFWYRSRTLLILLNLKTLFHCFVPNEFVCHLVSIKAKYRHCNFSRKKCLSGYGNKLLLVKLRLKIVKHRISFAT